MVAGSDSSDNPLSLSMAVQQLEKEFGCGIVVSAADSPVLDLHRIPTSIFPLDMALGGGIPAGHLTLVWGRKSAGKTTTVLKAIAQYQSMCGRCFRYVSGGCTCKKPLHLYVHWNDVEGTFDKKWATKCGVDLDGLQISRPSNAEQAIDVFTTMERCNDVGLVVMDSIAQLVPQTEVEKSSSELQQALGARLVNKFVRVAVGLKQEAEQQGRILTIILINQARTVMTSYGHGGEITPYGLQQVFGASVILRMMRGDPQFDEQRSKRRTDPETGERIEKDYQKTPTHVKISFLVERSKVSAPKVEGEFNLMLKPNGHLRITDTDDFKEMMLQGQRVGYIYKQEDKDGKQKETWIAGSIKGKTLDEIRSILLADRGKLAIAKKEIIERAHQDMVV